MVDLREAARELVERTTRAQGLPFYIEDTATLRQIAVIVDAADRSRSDRGAA